MQSVRANLNVLQDTNLDSPTLIICRLTFFLIFFFTQIKNTQQNTGYL